MLSRWTALDNLIGKFRQLWQYRPFDHPDYPWRAEFPQLAEWLDGLSIGELTALDRHPRRLMAAVTPFLPALASLPQLIALPSFDRHERPISKRLIYRIPNRKVSQIMEFAAAAQLYDASEILEWCAGKGHLGRLIAAGGAAVTGLEIDQWLCECGEDLARRARVNMSMQAINVSDPAVGRYLTPATHVAALHACGHLHRHLLKLATRQKVAAVSLAPCCYHLGVTGAYRPLSQAAGKMQLSLSKFDIKLALQETVTGNARTTRLRDREMNWRLGFDALQREVGGVDRYATIPSAKESLLSQDFPAFCRWAAAEIDLPLSGSIDFERFLLSGQQRRPMIARMEIVRHVFRRALELWLNYDLTSFLLENGYQVQLGEFCSKEITPRNILIRAERND